MASISNVLAILRQEYPEEGDAAAASREDKKLARIIKSLLERHVSSEQEVDAEEYEELEVCLDTL